MPEALSPPSFGVTLLVHKLEHWALTSKNLRRSQRGSKWSGMKAEKGAGSPMSTTPTDPAKKRRYPRYALDIRVSVKVYRSEAPVELWGRSNEFGQDGIGVTLTGELNPGEVATLELTLPGGGAPLKLRALVRYRDGLRHGFEFLARDEMQRTSIRKTCELLSIGR